MKPDQLEALAYFRTRNGRLALKALEELFDHADTFDAQSERVSCYLAGQRSVVTTVRDAIDVQPATQPAGRGRNGREPGRRPALLPGAGTRGPADGPYFPG